MRKLIEDFTGNRGGFELVVAETTEEARWHRKSDPPSMEGKYICLHENPDSGLRWVTTSLWVKDRSVWDEYLPATPGWIDIEDNEVTGCNRSVCFWRPVEPLPWEITMRFEGA